MKKSVGYYKGVQFPARLGTLSFRPTPENVASYAQNVDFASDEYGAGALVPGPALTTIGNNSELTGVPTFKASYNNSAVPYNYVYFAQSILGTKTVIRRIKDVASGSTPVIDTTGTMTVNHSDHNNQEIVDMVFRPDSSNNFYIYVAIKDDTDTVVYKFTASDANPSLSLIQANANFTGGYTSQFLVRSTFDNYIYWIGQTRVSSFDTADAYTVAKLALGLPLSTYATCGADWQQQLVVAYTDAAFGGFEQRKIAGKSGVALWDYVSPGILRNVPAPCRYISALIPAPDGSLLAFGGVDEGKSSIYNFTGYGFQFITSYIGDMPRSRHSIEFDAQGRVLWQTADGQFCRYDFSLGKFEHLGSISTASSAGGMLAKGIGTPTGNEFFVASGSGTNYTLKKVQFGSYGGDGGGSDGVTTPLVASGLQVMPYKGTIISIEQPLAKPLEAGEKLEVRVYKNGSTTDYVTYMTLDYNAGDRGSSKKVSKTLAGLYSYTLVAVWKQADGISTAPPVLPAVVEIQETQ